MARTSSGTELCLTFNGPWPQRQKHRLSSPIHRNRGVPMMEWSQGAVNGNAVPGGNHRACNSVS